MSKDTHTYPIRSAFVQWVCPAPKRHLQQLITQLGLRTGLDIGCGDVSPLSSLRSPHFQSTGIDVDAGTVERAKLSGSHDHFLVGDFMQLDLSKQFDVVVLSHVIEHFDRDAGYEVMRRLEQVATRVVYIETPFGFLEQNAFDGNPWQRHFSGWFPHDFESRGYAVYGSGPLWLRQPMGRVRRMPEILVRTISRSLQWYYFRHPSRASTIAAIRCLDEAGNLVLV